jgi:pilus assembly protein CpaE
VNSQEAYITVLIVDDTRAHADQITQILSREAELNVQIGPADIEEATRLIRREPPDIVLLSAERGDPVETVQRLDAASPTTAIIVLLTTDQEDLAKQCLFAGARAYITHIYNRNDLIEAIFRVHEVERRRRLLLSQAGVIQGPRTGRVLALHGSKGGVGATTIAVNLAVALRTETGGRVALVDGNLYSGDVAVSLNIISRNSITDLLPHLRDLDKDLLEKASVVHRSGVSVLLGPEDLESAETVSGDAMQRILKAMRAHFDFIVVDTCSLPDQVTGTALDNADVVLLVATPELPSLKNAARFIRRCREIGYPADKLMLIVNRENSRGAIPRADIEENLKLKVAVGIRSDGRTLIKATNAGEPAVAIDRRSRLSRGIRELVRLLTTEHQAEPRPATNGRSRGPLAWLARRA